MADPKKLMVKRLKNAGTPDTVKSGIGALKKQGERLTKMPAADIGKNVRSRRKSPVKKTAVPGQSTLTAEDHKRMEKYRKMYAPKKSGVKK